MKNKYVLFFFVMFSYFFIIENYIFASSSNGTINPNYRYAWGENVGFVDFGSEVGNVHVTDSTLSGFIYGENIGWIDLSTVTNTNEGILSGYAWGENIGWVDFSKVTIDSSGIFLGSAYGENIGWITFGTEYNKVTTDWIPESARPKNSSGSSAFYRANFFAQQTALKQLTPFQPIPVQLTPKSNCSIVITLRQGSKGKQVKCLQNKLNISVDGIFGPKTKIAVIKFQKENKLKFDGIVGPVTRLKLK